MLSDRVRRFILAVSAILGGGLVAYLLLLFVSAVWWAPYAIVNAAAFFCINIYGLRRWQREGARA